MKKLIAVTLTAVMLLSMSAGAFAAVGGTTAEDIGNQIKLIYNSFSNLRQNDSPTAWYYTVTDLDHNGRLELMAATATTDGLNDARLKAWEVSQDGQTLQKITHEYTDAANPAEADQFVNMMTDSADTFYDPDTQSWYYIFTNFMQTVIDGAEGGSFDFSMTLTCGVSLHGGVMNCGVLGTKVVNNADNRINVFCFDKDQNSITDEQMLNIAYTTFAGKQRSNTGFDWFTANDAGELTRFVDSYAVFDNTKTAGQATPVFAPQATGSAIYVTKNPTNENRNAGDTAYFVANATNYTSLSWTFVSPDGSAKTPQEFMNTCGGSVGGQDSTTLSISNVNGSMGGWGAYCTFSDGYQTARTTTAYLYINYNQTQAQNNQNLKTFYNNMTYLYGGWICPWCEHQMWGSYCTNCGFDPDYYYHNNYRLDDGYNYYNYYLSDEDAAALGLLVLAAAAESGELDYRDFEYNTPDWYCPSCGNGCAGDRCWYCGYSPYDSSSDYIWVEPDYSDYWGDYDYWFDDSDWSYSDFDFETAFGW